MLVLTRKRSEMIQIGDDVVVKIIQTGRNIVKVGIEAPSHVRVLRSELEAAHPSPTLAERLKQRRNRVPAVAVAATPEPVTV
jgi:carbon storage regulator CsrA